MDIDQSATFLAGSILTALGFVVIIIAVIFVNNILHKYWKPVRMFTPDSWKGFFPPEHMVETPVAKTVEPVLEKAANK
jgi:hypothetical protein